MTKIMLQHLSFIVDRWVRTRGCSDLSHRRSNRQHTPETMFQRIQWMSADKHHRHRIGGPKSGKTLLSVQQD
jgi:hypothetical protein